MFKKFLKSIYAPEWASGSFFYFRPMAARKYGTVYYSWVARTIFWNFPLVFSLFLIYTIVKTSNFDNEIKFWLIFNPAIMMADYLIFLISQKYKRADSRSFNQDGAQPSTKLDRGENSKSAPQEDEIMRPSIYKKFASTNIFYIILLIVGMFLNSFVIHVKDFNLFLVIILIFFPGLHLLFLQIIYPKGFFKKFWPKGWLLTEMKGEGIASVSNGIYLIISGFFVGITIFFLLMMLLMKMIKY